MRDSANWLWARVIVQRNMRATVFLVVFIGLAAGASMTAWEFARRAATVVDRRIDLVLPADGILNTCPPGADPGVDITPCFAVASNQTAYQALIASPAVAAASLSVSVQLAVSTTRDNPPILTFGGAAVERLGGVGAPVIISGREPSDEASDEVVLAEATARRLGLGTGSVVWIAACTLDFGQGTSTCGESLPLRVVGVTRTERDLLPQRRQVPGSTDQDYGDFGVFASAAWFESFGNNGTVFVQTAFRLAQDAEFDDVRVDVEQRLPAGWTVLVAPNQDATTFDGLRQSTRLQANAFFAIAAILALAGAVFIAQALTRQTRREMADRSIARSLGMTRGNLAAVALIRGTPIAVGGAAIAVVGSAVASAFGPLSLAGRAEVEPGVLIDLPVLILGAVAVVALVLTVSTLGAMRGTSNARHQTVRVLPTAFTAYAPPTAIAGLALSRSPRSGGGGGRTAILSTAVAIVGVITAGIVVDGLDAVLAEPSEFGASWQYSFTDIFGAESVEQSIDQFKSDPLITDVALVGSSGPLPLESIPAFWALSFTTVKGDLGPVIVEGRAPLADDEVAVGISTLNDLGKGIGDEIDSIPLLATGGAAVASEAETLGPLTIVGVALISDDTLGIGPGKGIILTESARLLIDPAASSTVLVRTDPDVPEAETVRRLRETYGGLTVPSPQSDLWNLTLISATPWLVALLIAALAAGALGHSLISVVRRNRRDIGVLRALGFTRRQVSACVSWHASRLSVIAIALGVPFGIIAGRWAWEALASAVGFALDPVVGVVVPLLAAVATLVAANVVAAIPARQAHRDDLIDALRDE